jgi:TPR repeat protein
MNRTTLQIAKLALILASSTATSSWADFDKGMSAYKRQDYSEAAKEFRIAAAQGHAGAQNNLAAMYTMGLGVPADHKEALKWLRLAADQGSANAQKSLGWLYFYGRGVPRSRPVAYALFNVSANTDSSGAASVAMKTIRNDLSHNEVVAGVALSKQVTDSGQLLKTIEEFVAKAKR